MKKLALIFSVYVATFFFGVLFVVFLNALKTKPTILIPQQNFELKIEEVEVSKDKIAVSKTEIENFADEVEPNYAIKLLETGNFHGGDVIASSGETWLGLFKEGQDYFLRKTRIKILNFHDEIIDEKKWQKTGKSVILKEKQKNIFLLSGAKNLQEGKIMTLFQGLKYEDTAHSDLPSSQLMTELKQGFSQKYKIQENTYELKVIDSNLVLIGEGKQQILHKNYDNSYGLGRLYWVGDLDFDNKPDFYLDLFEHYNVRNQVLFLSSEAEKDNLVKKVAMFWTTGC